MKLFLKILILVFVFLLWFYAFDPSLFQKFNQKIQNNTINTTQYVLTPNPAKFFLFNLKVSSSKNYNTDDIVAWAKLYFDAVCLFNVNILNLLENSNDKKMVLNTHIAQLENMQNKLANAITSLTNNYNDEYTLYQTYLASKQEWDQQFTNWFIDKDANLVGEWLSQSYQNWPKATEHRILANWQNIVLNKLKFVKQLIDAKLLLLTNNSNNIITNFALMKWNILIKLLKLKQRLETNNYN